MHVKRQYYVIAEGYFQSGSEATQWEDENSGLSFGPFSTYEGAEQGLVALMRSGRFLGAKIGEKK